MEKTSELKREYCGIPVEAEFPVALKVIPKLYEIEHNGNRLVITALRIPFYVFTVNDRHIYSIKDFEDTEVGAELNGSSDENIGMFLGCPCYDNGAFAIYDIKKRVLHGLLNGIHAELELFVPDTPLSSKRIAGKLNDTHVLIQKINAMIKEDMIDAHPSHFNIDSKECINIKKSRHFMMCTGVFFAEHNLLMGFHDYMVRSVGGKPITEKDLMDKMIKRKYYISYVCALIVHYLRENIRLLKCTRPNERGRVFPVSIEKRENFYDGPITNEKFILEEYRLRMPILTDDAHFVKVVESDSKNNKEPPKYYRADTFIFRKYRVDKKTKQQWCIFLDCEKKNEVDREAIKRFVEFHERMGQNRKNYPWFRYYWDEKQPILSVERDE